MVIRFFKIMSTFALIALMIAACSFYSGDKGGNSKNYTSSERSRFTKRFSDVWL